MLFSCWEKKLDLDPDPDSNLDPDCENFGSRWIQIQDPAVNALVRYRE